MLSLEESLVLLHLVTSIGAHLESVMCLDEDAASEGGSVSLFLFVLPLSTCFQEEAERWGTCVTHPSADILADNPMFHLFVR